MHKIWLNVLQFSLCFENQLPRGVKCYFGTDLIFCFVTGKKTEENIYAQSSKKLTPSPRTYDNARRSSSHDRGRRNRVSTHNQQERPRITLRGISTTTPRTRLDDHSRPS